MLYRDDHGNEEWIWNSRDGVSPFCLMSPQGLEARHVEWSRDRYAPNHVPEIGDRIFVDMTPDRAKQLAETWFDRMSQLPDYGEEFRKTFPDREMAVTEKAFENLKAFWPHSPDVVVVDEKLREQFEVL